MAADVDALNYPYIRVRSAEWLKRTLLIFPHVARMTPHDRAPADDPEVSEFCFHHGNRGPLLRSVDLWAPHVRSAQTELIRQLDAVINQEGSDFRWRFSKRNSPQYDQGETKRKPTIWELRLSRTPSFQIHRRKVLDDLADYLHEQELAWTPDFPYEDGPEYFEMNPRLGEAVMATLAVACAENEGLQVVTEFPDLHGRLIGVPRQEILASCLEERPASGRTSGDQIAEFLVYRRCDVSNLTPERLAALKSERDALAEFRGKLEELAKTLPPTIHSESTLEQRLNDVMTDIFRGWERDQANLSSYARKLFGEGALNEPSKLVQKLVEGVFKPGSAAGAAGGAGGAAIAGLPLGGLTLSLAVGAAAGFAVAVIFRAVGAWGEVRKAARESPFRYLTTLQDQGVAFSLSH